MNNQQLKAQLIQQLNETTRTLHQLEGAIQIIQQLEERDASEEKEAEEPSGASAAPIPVIED